MLATPPKVILVLVVMATLQVVLVLGLKCYECSSENGKDIKTCLAPDPKKVQTEAKDSRAVIQCTVSISYNGPTKKPIIEIIRDITVTNKDDSETAAELAKRGEKVMADCSDVKKFPEPVRVEEPFSLQSHQAQPNAPVEYRHVCYCAKDMCNSAIIPNP